MAEKSRGANGFEPVILQYGLTIEDLSKFAEKYTVRNACEEVDMLEAMGGEEALKEKLGVNAETGLTSEADIRQRAVEFGANKLREKKPVSFCEIVKDAAEDLTLRILFCCGLASLVIGESLNEHKEYAWIEGFAILVAVFIVVAVTSLNDYKKQKKFRELQEIHKNRKHVSVFRSGAMISLHPTDLVVGDIVELTMGLLIPADGFVIQSFNLSVSEAAITGENEMLRKEALAECRKARDRLTRSGKTPKNNHEIPSFVCLGGTEVREGKGLMIVTGVGLNSSEGRIMDLAEQEDEGTPLEKKLDNVAKIVSKFGLCAAIVAVIALFLRFGIELAIGTIEWDTSTHVVEMIRYMIIGITILVVAIPEGLPLAVTISLAYSVIRMQKDNNLVKKMESCETMGGANMICSDKTGTLTTNVMTVVKLYSNESSIDFEKNQVAQSLYHHDFFSILKEGIFTNTSAEDVENNVGSPTELAFLKLMQRFGHSDWNEFRRRFRERFYKMVPFNSDRKKGSAVVTLEDGRKRMHVMGAAEKVILGCTHYLDSEARPLQLTREKFGNLETFIASMGSDGLRTITVAYRDIDGEIDYESLDSHGELNFDSENLTLICIAGIKDPVRVGVPEAVESCRNAGIKVRMVTGDSVNTARAIAKECRILAEDYDREWGVMEGQEFHKLTGGTICKNCQAAICPCPRDSKKALNGEELREDVVQNLEVFEFIISRLDVLARSRPQDKYTLVTGLKQLGHVVAVTGDGTNDAPALKKADVGFAMGSGTEIARETADIILIDDNFVSIVGAVRWGRNIYDNIQRFIQFQLTVNVVAVVCAVVGAITIQQSPLTATQMLWVNLIMDTMASLALATAPPSEEVMGRLPQARNDAIITRRMWRNILGMAAYQIAVLFVLTYAGEWFLPEYGCSDDSSVRCNPDDGDFVVSGRMYSVDGGKDYYDDFNDPDIGPSRHFTYIFNIFVIMQLANEFNSHCLHDELNVFGGLRKNPMFLYIWLFTLGTQVLMVQVGSFAMGCHKEGLTGQQWGICIAIGLTPFLWRLVLRKVPIRCLRQWGAKEIDLQGEGPGALGLKRDSKNIEKRRSSSIRP